MKIYQKFLSGHVSGKCHLTLMFPNKLKKLFFCRKKNISNHPVVFFNTLPINRKSTQKHLGLLLDEKSNFSEHINEKLKKVTQSINLLLKLNVTLPCFSLSIIYKSFIRPHLDYGDIVYDQPNYVYLKRLNLCNILQL